jgi:HAD superfamily hydrolase (TIGR01509 family)
MNIDKDIDLQCVIFDWTGVLVDEIDATGLAHIDTIHKLGGKETTLEYWKANIGADWEKFYFDRGVSHREANRAFEVFKREFHKYKDLVKPYPGAIETLSFLKASGLRLMVLSGQQRDVLIYSAKRYGLYDFFDLIVTSQDVPYIKTDPESLRYILRKFDLAPTETVYIEDMSDGITMAKKVGVITIGIGSSLNQDLSNADIQINELIEIKNLIVGAKFTGVINRNLAQSPAEYIKTYDSRYKDKITGSIQRVSSFYQADNYAFAMEVLSWNVIPQNSLICNLGCGLSNYTQHFIENTGSKAIELDISFVALSYLGTKQPEKTKSKRLSVNGDLSFLPFPDNNFDVVICSETLEHVIDDRRSLAEISRTLKNGGYLVISIPTNLQDTLFLFRGLQNKFNLAGHVREYSIDYVIPLIKSLNFEIIRCQSSSFFIFWLFFSFDRLRYGKRLKTLLSQYSVVDKFLKSLIGNLIYWENFLFRNTKYGIRTLYLAKKHANHGIRQRGLSPK